MPSNSTKSRDSVIRVHKLVKRFGTITAVKGISFEVYRGQITGLLGPNGAGKTTTIQMILDLITPTSGKIEVLGKDLHANREEVLDMVNFSSPYVAMPNNLKVRENLATFARLYGIKDINSKINELADFFNIRDLLPKMTSTLSTGQLTRLNLTKAFLNDPQLLLLDEPTASLDPDIADRVRKMLLRLQKEKKVSILYTSHNMQEIEEICDRVIFINKGVITDDGTPRQLVKKYGHKDLNEVFLTIARGEDNGEWSVKS